jgi:hypothetical protein
LLRRQRCGILISTEAFPEATAAPDDGDAVPRPDDELARLQRIAFGSGSSEQERADAARELDALRAGTPAGPSGHAEGEAAGVPVDSPTAREPDVAARTAGTDEPRVAVGRRRWLQVVIGVGGAALVVGIVAGWQLGARTMTTSAAPDATPTATPPTEPLTLDEYLGTLPLAVESRAADVFATPLTADDVPDGLSLYDAGTGAPEYRLLAVTAEGVRIYASRSHLDLCLIVTTPAGGDLPAGEDGTCTRDGRLPEAGLGIDTSAVREVVGADGSTNFVLVSFSVTWTADGSLSFGPER